LAGVPHRLISKDYGGPVLICAADYTSFSDHAKTPTCSARQS